MKLLHTKYIIGFCFLIISGYPGIAQNVDNLRLERESLLKEIENTTRLLESKKSNREIAFRQLNILNKEISARERLIDNLKIQIESLERRIEMNKNVIDELEVEIQLNKQEYGQLLRDSYRRRNSLDELVYFLSATGFSEAYNRYRLLKEYTRYRKMHVENLMTNQARLKTYLLEVQSQMEQKEASLAELEDEANRLNNNKQHKRTLVSNLQKEEKWLLSELKKKEKKAKELEDRILEIIRLARRDATKSSTGADFSQYLGKLIWPVDKGVVVNGFGEHEHPVLKNVLIKNNGIDIQTVEGDDVFAVHSGEVSRVISIPGYNNAVIVRHGDYLTVYANLKDVRVKQGQKIGAGETVGKVFKESNDAGGILHFEIWNENQKMDPSKWLIP